MSKFADRGQEIKEIDQQFNVLSCDTGDQEYWNHIFG